MDLVRSQARETLYLDFKGNFWEDNPDKKKTASQEAAKDIAAFANSQGGTIILGIGDKDNRASGWNTQFDITGKRDKTLEFLRSKLDPIDVVNHLDIREIAVTDDGTQHRVLVVNIPPWPHGVVGVGSKERDSWYYPFRVDDRTHFFSLGEAMSRNSATHRPLFLRFKRLYDTGPAHKNISSGSSKGVKVRFASTVVAQGLIPNSTRTTPVSVPLDNGCHGALVEVHPDSIMIAMNGYTRKRFDGSITPKRDIESGELLSVPYELVSAVWCGAESQNPAIHMVLQATVCWMDDHWALDTAAIGINK